MLVARQVFRAKYGRGDELVALFQELNTRMREAGERRRTSASSPTPPAPSSPSSPRSRSRAWPPGKGRFRESMERPWMGEWFSRMTPLVESGSREFYNIVE